MNDPSIFSWIQTEEKNFQTDEVRLGDNWNWNFRNHVQLIFHLKNSIFYTGENNWMRAFKNIMEPILNSAYWNEDIEVKDVLFFIEERTGRVLSFLVKKFYDEVYVKENNLDTLFDEITESDLDYGGALVQKTADAKPEVFELNSIAFCDQTDILGGPIAFKHNFAPDKLRGMSKFGWGEDKNGATISIEDLIVLAEPEKTPAGMEGSKENKTTGKNIEVYIVRGNLPEHYLKDNDEMEYYCNQIQIVAYYRDKKSNKIGVTLYRKKEDEGNLKFHTSKKIHGRALGRGVGEGLIHPQLWTNFATIHKMNFLEAASKVPLWTDDPAYTQRQKIQEMENLEITTVEKGSVIGQVPTASPANLALFTNSVNEWYEQAQLIGSAFDSTLGKEESSGTTFKGQERLVAQGRGLHDRRRGQRAKFFEEIYRDWIIPDMVKQILKGKKFLATLSSEEMQWVSDQLAENYASHSQLEAVLKGNIPEDREVLKQTFLKDFSKKGNKHLIEILKGEFKDIEIRMGINIAGKQKDLARMTDKVSAILQTVLANPQNFLMAMQIPGMSEKFSDVLEFSGINQVDFSALLEKMTAQQAQMNQAQNSQPTPSPMQNMPQPANV